MLNVDTREHITFSSPVAVRQYLQGTECLVTCEIKEGRKEMFHLTTHSTHFILTLYRVGHMVKDHSDSERGNPIPPHRLLFPINSKFVFNAPSYRQGSIYNGLCYTSCGALAGTRNSSMDPSHEGSIRRPIAKSN